MLVLQIIGLLWEWSVAGVSMLYCVTVRILVLGVVCVTVSSVVFMEGTVRQCSVARLLCCIV